MTLLIQPLFQSHGTPELVRNEMESLILWVNSGIIKIPIGQVEFGSENAKTLPPPPIWNNLLYHPGSISYHFSTLTKIIFWITGQLCCNIDQIKLIGQWSVWKSAQYYRWWRFKATAICSCSVCNILWLMLHYQKCLSVYHGRWNSLYHMMERILHLKNYFVHRRLVGHCQHCQCF